MRYLFLAGLLAGTSMVLGESVVSLLFWAMAAAGLVCYVLFGHKPAAQAAMEEPKWVRRSQLEESPTSLPRPFLARSTRKVDELPLEIQKRVDAHKEAQLAELPPSMQDLVRQEAMGHPGRMLRRPPLARQIVPAISRGESRQRRDINSPEQMFGQVN